MHILNAPLTSREFNRMKLPRRSTMISGLKTELPFNGRKSKTSSPQQEQKNYQFNYDLITFNKIMILLMKLKSRFYKTNS